MSAALDRLLAELTPPPVPAGLAERVAAAARAATQEPHSGRARRAAAWRDRRGRWRRGLVIGAGAFGLAVSSAVAATLAGVPLPAKVEAVIAKLPLIGKETPEPIAPRPRPRPVERAAAPLAPAPAAERLQPDPVKMHELRQLRRLAAARQIVEARRAAGLPTPRADRIEHRMERRIEWWRQATPEQRQRIVELRQRRQEARRARIEARRAASLPPSAVAPSPPAATAQLEPVAARRVEAGPAYGPVDPRTARAPADGGQRYRLRDARAERLERLRQQRLERTGTPMTTQPTSTVRPAPTTTRPAPARRTPPPPPPPIRRPAPTRTTR